MKKILLSLILVFLFTKPIYAEPSLIAKLYCSVLGNKDASKEYREKVYQVLKQHGVNKPEDVPVKQMNGIGPAFARLELSSFTAFGIWLDENFLDICTDEQKDFHIYHEVSHYVKYHHQKILALSACLLTLIATGFTKLNRFCSSSDNITRYSVLTGATAFTLLTSYLYLLPNIVKRQEKEADILAAKALINAGKSQVVDNHIENLKKYINSPDDIWWYSNKEQIKYLEDIKKS